MRIWQRTVDRPTLGETMEVCFEHGGKWYGLGIPLSGPHSPWGRIVAKTPETRRQVRALLVEAVQVTGCFLREKESGQPAPGWANLRAEAGGVCTEFRPHEEYPSIGLVRFLEKDAKGEPEHISAMRMAGWKPAEWEPGA